MVIEVGMGGRNHEIMMVVLQFRQFVRQKPGVMIVDQRDAPHHERIRILHRCIDEAITYQIPKGFGTVSVAALLNETVKTGQEIGIDGDAGPCQLSHV